MLAVSFLYFYYGNSLWTLPGGQGKGGEGQDSPPSTDRARVCVCVCAAVPGSLQHALDRWSCLFTDSIPPLHTLTCHIWKVELKLKELADTGKGNFATFPTYLYLSALRGITCEKCLQILNVLTEF